MISFIRGKVAGRTESSLIIENGGVGFEVGVSNNALFNISDGNEALLHTYLYVREDALSLFGFQTAEERTMFLKLISVSGIGPKLAMSVLSGVSTRDLALSIVLGDAAALSRIKGVGKKTAERIILELKEKVAAQGHCAQLEAEGAPSVQTDAELALAALGISRFEAAKTVAQVYESGLTVEQLITKALKKL